MKESTSPWPRQGPSQRREPSRLHESAPEPERPKDRTERCGADQYRRNRQDNCRRHRIDECRPDNEFANVDSTPYRRHDPKAPAGSRIERAAIEFCASRAILSRDEITPKIKHQRAWREQ